MVALNDTSSRFHEQWRKWTFYLAGIDPAPAIGPRSDDGVIVAGRVQPRYLPKDDDWHSKSLADWYLTPCYAYRCRKMSGRQWGGKIHEVNRRFGLVKICMDYGSGGGGGMIMRELRHTKQLINGVEEEVAPICTADDALPEGRPILTMFGRGDPDIKQMWPNLSGDDMLVDAMHVAALDAFSSGCIVLPSAPKKGELSKVHGTWPEEKRWSHKLLLQGRKQLESGRVLMKDDGGYVVTKRGARQFNWTGKKDIAYAILYLITGFKVWLESGEDDFLVKGEDSAMTW